MSVIEYPACSSKYTRCAVTGNIRAKQWARKGFAWFTDTLITDTIDKFDQNEQQLAKCIGFALVGRASRRKLHTNLHSRIRTTEAFGWIVKRKPDVGSVPWRPPGSAATLTNSTAVVNRRASEISLVEYRVKTHGGEKSKFWHKQYSAVLIR